jgi:hypothetical protein
VNTYRNVAAALAACAACLSLAACSAGITTASTGTTGTTGTTAATSSSSASRSTAATASPAATGRTIEVSGEVGPFQVPPGAKVAENIATDQEVIVFFSLVTPAKVESFYTRALPRAGYKVGAHSAFTQDGGTVAFIHFTGHGFNGSIYALSKFDDPSVSIAGLGHKNVTTVTFTRS